MSIVLPLAPWMTPEEEARSVRIAAARAGCVVRDIRVADTIAGPRAIGHVTCRDGWAAAMMLLSLCAIDATTAGARDVALAMRGHATTDRDFAAFVHRYVQENVAFVREQGEVFAGPSYTLVARGGDCDDHIRLTYALLAAGGLPVRLAFLYHAHETALGPSHVVVQVRLAGRWTWVETTIAADFGEDPLEAATRLGVVGSRGDLATEVRTMSESDLPRVPSALAGFDVLVPARELARLGFYGDLPTPSAAYPAHADSPYFRVAVARFQAANPPLVVDGVFGPKTAAALSGIGPTIGDVTTPVATKDLPDEFFALVAQMARDFRAKGATVSGEDFLAVWLSESGCNPHCQGQGCKGPTAKYADFGGLNMMDSEARKNVGFAGSAADWVALSAVEQLPFVRKFYELDVKAFCGGSFACLKDLGSLYLLNFTPAFMSHANDPSFVIAAKDGPRADIYAANAPIDAAGKGAILVSDMAPFALRATRSNPQRWAELRARIRSAGEPPMVPPAAPGGGGVFIAGALVLAAMGAAYRIFG